MKNQTNNTGKNNGNKNDTNCVRHKLSRMALLFLADDLCVANWNKKATKPIFEKMIELAHELPVEEFSDFSKSMLCASRHDWGVAEIFLSYELEWNNPADHIAALCCLYAELWSNDATRAAKKVRAAIIDRSGQFRFYKNEMKEAA